MRGGGGRRGGGSKGGEDCSLGHPCAEDKKMNTGFLLLPKERSERNKGTGGDRQSNDAITGCLS